MSSLGALGIDVYANTAQFQSDMGKAARIAEREMANIQRVAARFGAAVGVGLAAGAAAFGYMIKESIATRAALDDLADTTGDNVQSLDGLRRSAYVAGVEFGKLEGILTKTAKGLDTKRGQSAIAALGLDIDNLKSMRPADAMMEIARALAHYEDGQGKVNVATAIWGKEGAKNLALMKDLAEAGTQQGRITAEMAAQAEKAEKEWRKLVLVAGDLKEGIASQVIPWVGKMLEQMNEGIRIAGSFTSALRLFGLSSTTAGSVKSLREELERLQEGRDRMSGMPGYGAAVAAADKDIEDLKKRLEFARMLERQEALRLTGPGFMDARDLKAGQRPGIGFSALGDGKAGKDKSLKQDEILRMQLQSWEQFQREIERGYAEMSAMESDAGKEVLRNYQERIKIQIETDKAYWLAREDMIKGESRLWEEENLATRVGVVVEKTKEVNDIARQLGLTFSSAFEDAALEGKNFSDVLKGLAKDVGRIFLRKTVTEPLGAAFSDLFKGGLGELFGGMFRAEGGPVSAGAPYIVGERGPELFVPGASGAIVPNHALAGGGPVFNVDMRGASLEAVQRLEAMVMRINGSIEPRAVAAVFNQNIRGNRP